MLLKLGVAGHLTRVLAPEGFGVLGYGLALVSLFGLVGSLGLDVLGTREVARSPERARTLADQIVGLRLALSSAAYVLYGLTLLAIPLDASVRAVLLIQGALLLVQALDVEWLYRGAERMGPVALRNVVADALQLAGVLLFVHTQDHLIRAVTITTGAAGVVAAGMWLSYRRDYGALRPRADLQEWRALLRPAIPLAASALMVMVYYSSDRLFIGWLRGASEVGLYEAAYRLTGLVIAPSHILYQAFFPSLSQAFGDSGEMRRRGRVFAEVMVAVGFPLAALAVVVAGPLVVWFAGAAYAAAAAPLAVLMATSGMIYANVVFGQALLAWNAHRPYVEAVVAGAVVNVVLNFVVIPRFGATGAAWTTLAAEAVALLRVATAYRALTGELPWLPVARAGVVAALGASVTWVLMQIAVPWLAALAVGGVAAAGASVLMGTVRPRQIAALIGRRGPG